MNKDSAKRHEDHPYGGAMGIFEDYGEYDLDYFTSDGHPLHRCVHCSAWPKDCRCPGH